SPVVHQVVDDTRRENPYRKANGVYAQNYGPCLLWPDFRQQRGCNDEYSAHYESRKETEGQDEFPAWRIADQQCKHAERSDSKIQRPRPSDPVADPTPGEASKGPSCKINSADIRADIVHLIRSDCP